MFLRRLYLKIRVFLYSVRHITNRLIIILMLTTLLCVFVNSFLFERLISSQATNYELSGKYSQAIVLYNIEDAYYSLFHFNKENKEIYFQIPYKKAVCYLKNNEKKKSINSILLGMTKIQKQYGIFSKETAYFIRKYLIEYYLDNNNYQLASQEFKNLLIIFKKIGYDDNEKADMIRLSGDLYYYRKQYDVAMGFYEKAYAAILKQSDIDYPTFVKIVNRIANYELEEGEVNLAIDIYKQAITQLETSGQRQNTIMAGLLLSFGDLYIKIDKTKDAISCYEKAIVIIKKLPHTSYLRQNIKTYLLALKDLYNTDGQFHKVSEIEQELTRKSRFSFL